MQDGTLFSRPLLQIPALCLQRKRTSAEYPPIASTTLISTTFSGRFQRLVIKQQGGVSVSCSRLPTGRQAMGFKPSPLGLPTDLTLIRIFFLVWCVAMAPRPGECVGNGNDIMSKNKIKKLYK